jgi:hypothetical protein
VVDLRLVGLRIVAVRRPSPMNPTETELVLARLEALDRPFLTAPSTSEALTVEGERETLIPGAGATLRDAPPWAEAMGRFESTATPDFFYTRVSAENRRYASNPRETRWADAGGTRLRPGGEIVGRLLGRFVVWRGGSFAVVDAAGATVLADLEARPFLDGDVVVVDPIDTKEHRFRFFDRDFRPIEGERGRALFAARAEERDRKWAELDAKIEADRKRSVEKSREQGEDDRRRAAIDARDREAAQRATAQREAAERREAEANRRVRYVVGDRIHDAMPDGWPNPLRDPAASMTGHYRNGELSCDVKKLERDPRGVQASNAISIFCLQVRRGLDRLGLGTTTVVSYGDSPDEYSIRTVQRGGIRYELEISPSGVKVVWSEGGGFELHVHERWLKKVQR